MTGMADSKKKLCCHIEKLFGSLVFFDWKIIYATSEPKTWFLIIVPFKISFPNSSKSEIPSHQNRRIPTSNYTKSVQNHPTPNHITWNFKSICIALYYNFICMRIPNLMSLYSQVCEEQGADDIIFPLATSYVDRFLACVRIRKTQLQLLGAVCLLIASKLRQCRSFTVDALIYYTDYSVSTRDITVSVSQACNECN